MSRGPADVEALRQRLYRPGASPHDLSAYLHAADAGPATGPADGARPAEAPADRGPSARPFVIGGVGVLAAAALGGALLLGGSGAPVVTPTAAAVTASGVEPTWSVAAGTRPVLDGGERDGARGVAVAEGPDQVRYTIAAGDDVGAVAQRFSLCQGDVLLALPYGVDPAAMPPDQTLELSRASTRSPQGC